jgi:hypothetical protein
MKRYSPFIFIFQILENFKKNANKNFKSNKVNPNLKSSLKPLLVGLTYHDIHVIIPSYDCGITPKDVCKFHKVASLNVPRTSQFNHPW